MPVFAVRVLGSRQLKSIEIFIKQHQEPRSGSQCIHRSVIFRHTLHRDSQARSKPPIPLPPLSRSPLYPFPDSPPSNSLHVSDGPFNLLVPSVLPPLRPERFLYPIGLDTFPQSPTVIGICYRCEFARDFRIA